MSAVSRRIAEADSRRAAGAGQWRWVTLVALDGLTCTVRIDDQEETWQFHADATATLESWPIGGSAKLSAQGLLRLSNNHLRYPCRHSRD